MFPRCGIPDAFAAGTAYDAFVRFLLDTGSIREHTEIWWTVRPHQSFGTVEMRACDGLPDVDESLAAVRAPGRAGGALRAAATTRARRCRRPRHRELEENLWRALRFGLSRELIDLERAAVGARAPTASARCSTPCGPEIDALGLGAVPAPLERPARRGDNAPRLSRGLEAGESLRDLFAEQVAMTRDPSGAR